MIFVIKVEMYYGVLLYVVCIILILLYAGLLCTLLILCQRKLYE